MEIGCWKGKSAFCLARGLRRGRLTVIDPFDASGDSEAAGSYLANAGSEPLLQQFTSHMNRLGVIDKIDIWHGTSQDYVGLARSVDSCSLTVITRKRDAISTSRITGNG